MAKGKAHRAILEMKCTRCGEVYTRKDPLEWGDADTQNEKVTHDFMLEYAAEQFDDLTELHYCGVDVKSTWGKAVLNGIRTEEYEREDHY